MISKVKHIDSVLNDLKIAKMVVGNSIIAFPSDEIEGLSIKEMLAKFKRNEFSKNLISSFKQDVENERILVLNEIKEFIYSKSHYTEFNSEGLSPYEVSLIVDNKLVKALRLMQIFNPDFYQSITRKSNGEEYDMVKIHWINDLGEKYHLKAKTYGKNGKKGLEFAMKKLVSDYFIKDGDQLYFERNDLSKSIQTDFIATINGIDWMFEAKLSDKNDFIRTAVRFELWKIYQDTYHENLFKTT